jgi:hypothetical protein
LVYGANYLLHGKFPYNLFLDNDICEIPNLINYYRVHSCFSLALTKNLSLARSPVFSSVVVPLRKIEPVGQASTHLPQEVQASTSPYWKSLTGTSMRSLIVDTSAICPLISIKLNRDATCRVPIFSNGI